MENISRVRCLGDCVDENFQMVFSLPGCWPQIYIYVYNGEFAYALCIQMLSPRSGIEPATFRLLDRCSISELPWATTHGSEYLILRQSLFRWQRLTWFQPLDYPHRSLSKRSKQHVWTEWKGFDNWFAFILGGTRNQKLYRMKKSTCALYPKAHGADRQHW